MRSAESDLGVREVVEAGSVAGVRSAASDLGVGEVAGAGLFQE